VGKTLLELQDRGVIAGSRARRLAIPDVAELWKRAQQLAACDRRRGRERPGFGNAEERIGDLLLQRRPQRQLLGSKLVDVHKGGAGAAIAQVVATRSDIPDRHRYVSGELPL
jgi:hypothetical protein